jgi:glycosyltransferase involved in cell wall biosynthesis
LHASLLDELGDWLADKLQQEQIPDLLVGHKLTIEGIVVARAASAMGIPYALCLQGNTEARILAMRPDLRERFAQIYHHADFVFPFAPWTKDLVDEKLGRRGQDYALLPCPTDLDETMVPAPHGDGFVTAFHLWNYRQKNLAGLVDAMRILAAEGNSTGLTVIGGGEPAIRAKCERMAHSVASVKFAGPFDRAEMAAGLNKAVAMVLPSLRESFGLVFVEALFAGTPIIYPAGTAVDGYFDGLPFAIRVDARDPRATADAMRRAIEGETEIKTALAEWQQSDAAEQFRRAHIAHVFAQGLRKAADSGAYS